MTTVTIRHTFEEGTTVTGSAKGDTVLSTLRTLTGDRWGWFPTLRVIGRRNSRDRVPDLGAIDRAETALIAAGHTVIRDIDTAPGDRGEAIVRATERAADRHGRLEAAAKKRHANATARFETLDRIAEAIPFGQPIIGAADARRRENLRGRRDLAMRISREGTELDRRAAAVIDIGARVSDRGYLGRKIETLGAEVRRLERDLGWRPDWQEYVADGVTAGTLEQHLTPDADGRVVVRPAGVFRDRLTARLDQTRVDLAAYRELLARVDSVAYGPGTVKVGGMVLVGGRWARVARVNGKTVSVETPYSWTARVPWTDVTGYTGPPA